MPTKTFVLNADDAPQPMASSAPPNLEKYRKELNAAQFEAVTTTEGALLVVAGAGTGKTKTLTYRVGYLIESGVAPQSILLLTFTRRAAEEMLNRAATVVDARCARVEGGTFHAYAHKLLRQYGAAINLAENFIVLDQADAEDAIEIVRTALGFHKKEKRFPKKNALLRIVSAAANKQLPIERIVETSYPQFFPILDDIQRLADAYRDYKRANSLLDYDDLLAELKRLLTEREALRQTIASQLRYVMVDEYQDTNLVQADLVALLSSVHGNVMAVGDDAQSIYSFRGANFRNILDFPKRFPNAKIIKLEENYRSTERILALTNVVINQAKEKFAKNLYTTLKLGGEFPAIVAAPDERYQSRFVAQRILELREEGVPLHRIAVLMRNGRDSYDLEIELKKRNLPFVKYGGQKIIEAAHIKDFVAHLRILYNPRDALSWNRALRLLEGIGPKTTQELVAWIKTAPNPYRIETANVSPRYADSLRRLGTLLGELSQKLFPLSSLAESLWDYYKPILRRVYYEDFPKREKDLENFLGIVANYDSLATLLSDLALEPIDLSAMETKATVKDEAPLTLSTIHSAKGLEWQVVFLINALDGVIPSRYAVGETESLDEELRLLYVALTRARDLLYICYPVICNGAEDYFGNPSRFLQALPEDLYEKLLLVDARSVQKPLNAPPAALPARRDEELPF
ncbi:MAG: ATP-dependent helicase [Chloroherpetonaceae bacterium]|nr:ATP-dependent helicase [Chloroherpetonaceae bacterium]MDW8438799.1 ATP-dependent helicase [Chloroherpetonaceae bacterium]